MARTNQIIIIIIIIVIIIETESVQFENSVQSIVPNPLIRIRSIVIPSKTFGCMFYF